MQSRLFDSAKSACDICKNGEVERSVLWDPTENRPYQSLGACSNKNCKTNTQNHYAATQELRDREWKKKMELQRDETSHKHGGGHSRSHHRQGGRRSSHNKETTLQASERRQSRAPRSRVEPYSDEIGESAKAGARMYGSEPAATHGEAQLPAAPAAYLSNDDLNWLSASDQVPLLGRQPSRHRRQVQPFELDGGRNQHLHTQILELEGPLVQPQEMEGEYGSTYQRVSRSYTAPHAPLAGSPQELPARSSRDQEGGATLYFPVTPSSTRSSQPTLEWERSSPHSKTRRASIALPPSAQPYGEYYGQAGNDHANQAPPSYPHHDAYRSANPTSGYSIPAAGTSVLPIAPSREGETTGRGPTWIKAIQPNSSSERSGKRKKDKGKLVDFGNSIVRSLTPQNHKRPPISRPKYVGSSAVLTSPPGKFAQVSSLQPSCGLCSQNIDPSTSTWGVKQYLDLQNPGAARSFCDLRALRATCGNDASWVAINPSKYKDILEENAEDDFTAREIWDLQKENCFLRNEYREKRSRWKRQ